MSILIEDSPRNLAAWITAAVGTGDARGAVVTPWATPWRKRPHRRAADEVADMVRNASGEVWFDPLTHALQMSGVGDFRYYDEYSLWSGDRGDLSTRALREDHVRRVFDQQTALGARHLGPTVLLHHAESATSQLALDMAEEAMRQDPDCWLSIAGTEPFWSSGTALDAHIGAMAQLDPKGWFLTVVRPLSSLPVEAHPDEVHGLCRTTRALSEYAGVHVSHGDLAGLPAVAAGAFSVGSGWDQRQRVCSFGSFAARSDEGGGGWYERPTLVGLLGSLKPPEAAQLRRVDAARAARLGPLPPPGPREAFQAHLRALRAAIATITAGEPSYERRFRALDAAYDAATSEWPDVCRLTSCELDETDWIEDLAAGLRKYGVDEGWTTP